VTIRSVAFVPAAPLLIPAVAAGSAALDDGLRAACRDAASRLAVSSPDEIVVVAGTHVPGEWPAGATWDTSGFGVAPGRENAGPTVPWPLGFGAWLLDECGWTGGRRYLGLGDGSAPMLPWAGGNDCALLVVGDGSACRSDRAPGGYDPRSEAFDRSVAAALGGGDTESLGRIGVSLAADLMCSGAPAWRWLAGALAEARPASAELLADDAPYGVGYFVALWSF
jgi:hypothetical protein